MRNLTTRKFPRLEIFCRKYSPNPAINLFNFEDSAELTSAPGQVKNIVEKIQYYVRNKISTLFRERLNMQKSTILHDI